MIFQSQMAEYAFANEKKIRAVQYKLLYYFILSTFEYRTFNH